MKKQMIERLKKLFEEGKIVFPSRLPIIPEWKPMDDASHALRCAITGRLNPGPVEKSARR